MSIFLSAGVYAKETDVSNIVANVSTSSAALVGYSAKGNVDDILLMTNVQDFINEYGEPDPSSGHYFHYSALAYLARGKALYCLRVHNDALYGGVDVMRSDSSDDNLAFAVGKSSNVFIADSGMETEVAFQIFGANPGVWNNKVSIIITDVKDGSDEVVTDQYTFKINVYLEDEDGNVSLVESWKVSRKSKVDGYGKRLYLESRINGVSKYITVANSALADTVLPKTNVVPTTEITFEGGSVGAEIGPTELIAGWDDFINPDSVDVRILINGGEFGTGVQAKINAVAVARADCIAVLDVPWASLNTVSDVVIFRTTLNLNSSYSALYAGWSQIYDAYNDILIDVPPSGYVAAQMAYNDFAGKPWSAPAGLNRGLMDVLAITGPSGNLVFTEGERDVLYVAGINPLQTFIGEGFAIWGQKTLQKKASALDRINVRRLLIIIEKAMAISLRPFVFEPNDATTRFRVEALLNSYLDDLSAQGAFQTEGADKGFNVVCDETNNTGVTIDQNELKVDVFVKPIRAAEYIQLNTIITATGASFEELISRGVGK